MAIDKEYFVTDINNFFNRAETAADIKAITEKILYDASTFGDVLLQESEISLAADNYYTSRPVTDSGGKCKKVLAIYYDDYELMEKVLWPSMKKQHENNEFSSKPQKWALSPDRYIFFSPIADKDYTFYCTYSYYHPLDYDKIEFDDEFAVALSYGVMWLYAMSKGLKQAAEDMFSLYSNTMRREAAQRDSQKIYAVKFKRGM